VFGLDCWAQAAVAKAEIGYLPGDIHLYERMTGHELLEFFAAFRPAAAAARRAELAERLELDLERQVRQLSKGNRQKLAIVQALMYGAPLLILDEPTSGLDPLKQSDFLELLEEERRRGVTVLLSSHQLEEVERVATRVAIIRDGRLVAIEGIEALQARRERTMQIVLERPAPVDQLMALAGVRLVSVDADGRRVKLAVRGPLQPLLRAVSQLPLADLIYGPPDLEDVFMDYYGRDQALPATEAEAAS
jgi:ABC-2 type transport system ATP-binding protein